MSATKSVLGFVLTIAMAFGVAGCDSSGGGASMDQMASAVNAQKVAKQQEDAAAAAKAAADQKAAETPTAGPASNEPPKKVGGRQTQGLGGGYFGAIAGARRHVMNQVDAIAWIQGVRSFKAEEGRKPKDNAEFMKVVVTKYELQLPKIEDDEEYLYDPNGESDGDFGQLYVVKKGTTPESDPAAAPAPAAK